MERIYNDTYVQLYNVIQKALKILLYEKHRTELKTTDLKVLKILILTI